MSGFIVVGQCLGSNIRGLGMVLAEQEETDDGGFPVLVLAWVTLTK